MSQIGRIFIVVNLLLAAVVLGWASATLGTAQDFKAQYEAKSAEYDALKSDTDEQIGTLTAAKNDYEQAKSTAEAQVRQLETDLSTASDALAVEKARNGQLDARIASIETTLGGYEDTANKNFQRAKDADERALAAFQAQSAAESERDDAVEARIAAETELDGAKASIAALTTALAGANKTSEKLETKLAMFADYTGVSLSELVTTPKIDGKVPHVYPGNDFSLVALNRGENDNVQRGYTFDVYSGDTYKGQVRVENVEAAQCTAIVIRTVDGETISRGDAASTRL